MSDKATPQESRDEAVHLIEQYQQTKDNDIATVLIKKYEPMVKMVAGKIAESARPVRGFVSGWPNGINSSSAQYDISLGIPFEPYAMKSMIGHMKNFLRDKSWYIQVPRRIKEKGALVQQAIDELMVKLERSPDVNEIASHLDLPLRKRSKCWPDANAIIMYHWIPLSQEETGATLGELISSDVNDFDSVEKRMDLQQAMSQLKEQEQKVLLLAFQEGQSQRAIAQRLGVSQMSVSRV